MAAQAPPKQPFQPVSETRRAFPIRGILDGFFNDIGENRPHDIASFVDTEMHGVLEGGLNGGILSSLEILVCGALTERPSANCRFYLISRYARFSIWPSSCLC
jgi:hypothetical protein